MNSYCADTSALIAAWEERYPPDHFPGLWDRIAAVIEEGRIIAPEEVRHELLKRSKELAEWLDKFNDFFRPTDFDVLTGVQRILTKHPRLVMARKMAFAADPFVIAVAQIEGLLVLTEEGTGSPGKPTIPLVCHGYSMRCVSVLDVIKAEGWVLSA